MAPKTARNAPNVQPENQPPGALREGDATVVASVMLAFFAWDQKPFLKPFLSLSDQLNARTNQVSHSHSIVAGGLVEMSYTTRFTPFTLLMISLLTSARNSWGRRLHSAVMPSVEFTARRAMVCS
jgi:hypothetical protein